MSWSRMAATDSECKRRCWQELIFPGNGGDLLKDFQVGRQYTCGVNQMSEIPDTRSSLLVRLRPATQLVLMK